MTSYTGKDGKTALELLQEAHAVETKTYEGLGEMVTSIDGTAAGEGTAWVYTVDGAPADSGADSFVTQDGQTIEWKLISF